MKADGPSETLVSEVLLLVVFPKYVNLNYVARRGLYNTAALCIADCALTLNGVPFFISRGATTPSGAGALY
jgi:hypothetical protein